MNLRPYQQEIVDHVMRHPRTNLFVPMGAGKTVSVLTALNTLSVLDDVLPALVVAPLRVANSTWPDEVRKWPHLRHLRVSVVTGTAGERTRALGAEADIYCTNFDNLTWLTESLGRWPFKTIVADEATRLKGFRTRQGTKRARALAQHAHKTPRYIGLTGTPAANGVQDLWALMWFVDKGQRLGLTFKTFTDRWFQTIATTAGFTMIRPLAHAQREIEERIKDICLSIDLGQYLDLKEPVVNTIKVELPKAAQKIYDAMEKEAFAEIRKDKDVAAFSAAAKTMKLLQIANGAVYVDESAGSWEEIHRAKLDALDSIVEEANGAPVLVAYHFRSDLVRLQKAFPKGRHLDADWKTIRDWNAGRIPVLFAHPASAGHGISLQDGGNIIAFFSLNWNLEERLQIIERIGPARQAQSGHDRPVFIHNIIAKGTIDELVLQRVEGKKEIVDLIMEAMRR